MNDVYSKEIIDMKMGTIHEKLDLILAQTTRHNGRLTRLERIMLVFGTALFVILIVNGSSLVQFILTLIK